MASRSRLSPHRTIYEQRRAAAGLRAAYADGEDLAARADMATCALLGGMALANARLGAVHGLAGVTSSMQGNPVALLGLSSVDAGGGWLIFALSPCRACCSSSRR